MPRVGRRRGVERPSPADPTEKAFEVASSSEKQNPLRQRCSRRGKQPRIQIVS